MSLKKIKNINVEMSLSSNAEKNLMIDADRLWESLMELAKIGPGVAGGNNRQTLTDEDREARDLLKSWCDKAGLSITIDAMGSMFAERAGEDPSALPEAMADIDYGLYSLSTEDELRSMLRRATDPLAIIGIEL